MESQESSSALPTTNIGDGAGFRRIAEEQPDLAWRILEACAEGALRAHDAGEHHEAVALSAAARDMMGTWEAVAEARWWRLPRRQRALDLFVRSARTRDALADAERRGEVDEAARHRQELLRLNAVAAKMSAEYPVAAPAPDEDAALPASCEVRLRRSAPRLRERRERRHVARTTSSADGPSDEPPPARAGYETCPRCGHVLAWANGALVCPNRSCGRGRVAG